jgi:hypothetical protein
MWGPEMAPHTPQRSSRPGVAGALLIYFLILRSSYGAE